MILLILACAVDPGEAPLDGLQVTEAEVVLDGGVQVWLAQATIDLEGTGVGVQVAAHVPPPAGGVLPPLDITAARSSWDLRERIVRFEGDVVATRGEVRLTCDRLVVHYEGPDRVERAEATGSVTVTRGDRTAQSERAVLTTQTGQVVLTGAPRLSEGPNLMSGQRIVLYLDDERVDCDACRLVVDGAGVAPRR